MAALSITTAWNEAAAFVAREARLLFPIAFLLVALPGGIVQLVMPVAAPGQTPPLGLWLLLLPVAAILSMIGTIALAFLALRPGASVAEALQRGVRRLPALLGASILLALGAMVLLVPLTVLLGGLAAVGGGAASPAAAAVLMLVFVLAAVALWARLLLMTSVTAVEEVGPIDIIRRSWTLTDGRFWRLFGFVLLVLLVFLVISAVAAAVGGSLIVVAAGDPHPGSLAAFLIVLISVAVNMVMTVYITVLNARIYRQLAGGGPEGVFA